MARRNVAGVGVAVAGADVARVATRTTSSPAHLEHVDADGVIAMAQAGTVLVRREPKPAPQRGNGEAEVGRHVAEMRHAPDQRLVGEVVVAVGLMDRAVEQGGGSEQQRHGGRQVMWQGFHGVLRGQGAARMRHAGVPAKHRRRRRSIRALR